MNQNNRDPRTIMAPAGTERWYDGEPKRKPAVIFRRGIRHTSLWLIHVVVSNTVVQVDHG
jgi:hypothetical protein